MTHGQSKRGLLLIAVVAYARMQEEVWARGTAAFSARLNGALKSCDVFLFKKFREKHTQGVVRIKTGMIGRQSATTTPSLKNI